LGEKERRTFGKKGRIRLQLLFCGKGGFGNGGSWFFLEDFGYGKKKEWRPGGGEKVTSDTVVIIRGGLSNDGRGNKLHALRGGLSNSKEGSGGKVLSLLSEWVR